MMVGNDDNFCQISSHNLNDQFFCKWLQFFLWFLTRFTTIQVISCVYCIFHLNNHIFMGCNMCFKSLCKQWLPFTMTMFPKKTVKRKVDDLKSSEPICKTAQLFHDRVNRVNYMKNCIWAGKRARSWLQTTQMQRDYLVVSLWGLWFTRKNMSSHPWLDHCSICIGRYFKYLGYCHCY